MPLWLPAAPACRASCSTSAARGHMPLHAALAPSLLLFAASAHQALACSSHNLPLLRGFAYVEYETRSAAEKARDHMDGGQVDGSTITVQFVLQPAKRREPSPPPRGRDDRGRSPPRRAPSPRRRSPLPPRRRCGWCWGCVGQGGKVAAGVWTRLPGCRSKQGTGQALMRHNWLLSRPASAGRLRRGAAAPTAAPRPAAARCAAGVLRSE